MRVHLAESFYVLEFEKYKNHSFMFPKNMKFQDCISLISNYIELNINDDVWLGSKKINFEDSLEICFKDKEPFEDKEPPISVDYYGKKTLNYVIGSPRKTISLRIQKYIQCISDEHVREIVLDKQTGSNSNDCCVVG